MSYLDIARHYDKCLEQYGDTHKGLDWPNNHDMYKRYQIMLEVIKDDFAKDKISLLDFGCGTSRLYEYILLKNNNKIEYSGLDISSNFIDICNKKFPKNPYYCVDVLSDIYTLPIFDYIVFNGVFTVKGSISFEEMFSFMKLVILEMIKVTRVGFAFNVMSKHVDWERDDLFHLPIDQLADFLCKTVTRNFIIRNDYGLYEYTVYVYP